MPSFWVLLAAAAALFGICLWWIRRLGFRRAGLFTAIRPKQRFDRRHGTRGGHLPIRSLMSISFEELRLLGQCNHDCILVDIRSKPLTEPVEVAGVFVISISPSELPEVLRWLPADRAIAFHGVSDSSFALIESSVCMDSAEPRCILEDLPSSLEIK
jgi:hypothetical protein